MSRFLHIAWFATRLRHGLALMLVSFACVPEAMAVTYISSSATYNPIDSSTHTKIGYKTSPYRFNGGATCGTVPPVLDDTITGAIPIGFNFVFGGVTYASAYVMSNGRLQFGNTTCGAGTDLMGPPQTYPYGLPDSNMNGVMKIFGVDLDSTTLADAPNYPAASQKTPCTSLATCYVSVVTIGTAPLRKFVVTWKNVPEWVDVGNTSGSFDLQIILNEDGSFVYQYGTIRHGGTGSAQVGWQVNTGDYQVLSFGAATEPAPNTAIVFYIPAPIAAYRFDEGAWAPGVAGQVIDSVTVGRSGKALGKVQPVDLGKVCRAANIPANTSAATVDAVVTGANLSNPALNMLGTGTASFWYQSNTAWTSGRPAQLLDATTVAGEWFYLARTAAGALVFEVRDNQGITYSVTTPAQTFAAGTWVHIAIAWDFNASPLANRDSLSIWINGGAPTVSTFSSNGTPSPSVGAIHLGDNPLGVAAANGTVNSADGKIDEAQFYNSLLTTAQIATVMAASRSCVPLTLDHLELQHATGTGLTCTPTVLTIRACMDAACTTPYTSGVSASLTSSGAVSVSFDNASGYADGPSFAIPPGSSSLTKGVQITTAGSTLLGVANVNVGLTGTNRCNFGSPSCTLSAADAGFLVSVPAHMSDTASTATISAVAKATNSKSCVPAFANVSKPIALSCSPVNPATGSLPVRVKNVALNASASASAACDGVAQTVSLAFDANGTATPSLQYADVGQVTLTAHYTGSTGTNDAGLQMAGSGSFISAPASFAFSSISPAPIKAGNPFAATVTALNASGSPTPSFGREAVPESVRLTFARRTPAGAGASDGVFSGSTGAFSAGAARATNLVWTEVGSGDLSATLTSGSYLGSGLSATGTTGSAGAVGRFKPHHFDVAVTQACSAGAFTYAGQPAQVTITARNGLATPGTTVNYDGSAATSPNQAQSLLLSEATSLGLGSLSGTAVSASAFLAGVATAAPSYTYTTKTTGPRALALRAIDADGVSSLGYLEGSVNLRSGRLRLPNAFGSSSQALRMPVMAEYWTGQAWLLNSADSCTTLPAAAVAVSNARNHLGNTSTATTLASAVTLSGGNGVLTLAAPTPAASVSLDVALNLGATAADQSCNAAHPATAPGARAWLRAANGSCAVTADRDPASRASFGLYAPETRKTVHARELF